MSAIGGPANDPPPYIKDRYRLVKWIGEGSMGVVYRAHDEMLDREIAIKFLPPERIAGSEASERFLREARAVARLSHPNIMTLYDIGRENGWHYLALEYIPGQNLHAHLVQNGAFSLRQGLQTIRGVLAALAYAHEQGLIHRDIKPENIMLPPDGEVKVTDFGLARVHGDVRLTQEGTLLGTILYLAPELIIGQPADVRSDLYAVGAVLYELLTGQPPFPGDQLTAVLIQTLHNTITPPSQYNPAIPVDIEQIIAKLLAKEPDDRFQSANEVLNALPDDATIISSTTGLAPAPTTTGSLVERIIDSSSTNATPPELLPHLLMTAALEDTTAAVESERRRLAGRLQESIIEPLNLLLTQANLYEQTMIGNPMAKMAISVLSTLARQALHQVRDLETTLHPIVLDTLGLEPALEALVNQTIRTDGLQITLNLRRLAERLPATIELILYRITQDALTWAAKQSRATEVAIHLALDDQGLVYRFSDNGRLQAGSDLFQSARPRIEGLGGAVEIDTNQQGGLDLTIRFGRETAVVLTPREMEVIQLLSEGLSNKEIAQILSLSPSTINFHLDNIYSKLGVNSRTEAAVYALRQGWGRKPG